MRGKRRRSTEGEQVFRVKLMSGSSGEASGGKGGESGRRSISRSVKNVRGKDWKREAGSG